MLFAIIPVENCYSEEEVDFLKQLGFTFTNNSDYYEIDQKSIDGSHKKDPLFMEIDSLSELHELQGVCGAELIIDFREMRITIYNGYLE